MKLKIEWHYSYLIVAFSFILIGYFKNLIVLTSLILIHELGHYLWAKLVGFEVSKITIYPYGGLTKIEGLINKDINKELLVAVSGFIFETLYYLIIVFLFNQNLIDYRTLNIFNSYHHAMLLFNILPIYPLDGFKIVNLILSKYMAYKKVNKLGVIISLVTLGISTYFYRFNYSYLITLSLLLSNIWKFYKELDYIYNKFLLERYLYNISYKKLKITSSKDKMFKNYRHLIKNSQKYEKEEAFLHKIFDFKRDIW